VRAPKVIPLSTRSDRPRHVIWFRQARYLVTPSTLSDHTEHVVWSLQRHVRYCRAQIELWCLRSTA